MAGKMQGASFMRVFGIATVIALLAGPAYAQVTPNVNLIPELQSKTPEEKEQEAAQQKAYKESLKKIPDAKASSDPWGNVRSVETPKTSAPAKPRTKTGSTAN
jgi:Tfp pilus assembly major pilin PilA